MWARSRWGATGLCLMAGLSSCTTDSDAMRACTEIGAVSGVTVTYLGKAEPGLSAEICLAENCQTTEFTEAPPDVDTEGYPAALQAMVPVPLTSDDRWMARLTVRSTERVLSSDQRVTLIPKKVQPNGPDCPPTAYQASLIWRDTSLTPAR